MSCACSIVDGLIGMDEMISKIDQRLTMMRMEGY